MSEQPDILEQGRRRRRIDARRKYIQEHKPQIILTGIGLTISVLILLFGILNYLK